MLALNYDTQKLCIMHFNGGTTLEQRDKSSTTKNYITFMKLRRLCPHMVALVWNSVSPRLLG